MNVFLKVSSEKLLSYFASYKNICNNFTVDIIQFEQIFNLDKNVFNIWNINEDNILDAFELFSGLIIYSTMNINDKIDCLFNSSL